MRILDQAVTALIYLAASYLLFWLGKLLYDLTHRGFTLQEELVEKDNAALALALVGYYFGLVLAIGGVLVGPSRGFQEDLIDTLLYGPLALLLMNLSAIINEKLILHRFEHVAEVIQDQNLGVGAVECATYVATGLILYGSLSGEGGSMLTCLTFWGLGQLALIGVGRAYAWIVPFDLHRLIEEGNVAVGVSFAGTLASMGNIIRYAVSGNFLSWGENLTTFAAYFLLGILLLPLIRWVTDQVLLPGATFAHEIAEQERPNLGVAFLEAFSYLGSSFLIGWCL